MAEHINSFTQVTGQLESAGINLDMKLQALLFICSLSESYNTTVQGISSTMKDDLTLNDIVSNIMNEEMRRKVTEEGKKRRREARSGPLMSEQCERACWKVKEKNENKQKKTDTKRAPHTNSPHRGYDGKAGQRDDEMMEHCGRACWNHKSFPVFP